MAKAMKRKVRTHSFNGKQYNIYIDTLKGVSDVSRGSPLSLFVRTDKMSERLILITIIHEAMHAGSWSKSEKVVDRTSEEIGDLLWRLGYRRVE